MHKSPFLGEFFEFDPEIDQTFHKLKRQRAYQEETTTSTMGGGKLQKEGPFRTMPLQELIAKLQA